MLVLFTVCLTARAAWSGAYSSGYEPLPNAKLFPVRSCQLEQRDSKRQEYVCHSKNHLSRMILHNSEQTATAEVEILRNNSLKARVRLSYVPWFDYALEGDLNRDGLPDYVLVEPSGGNGLASEYCHAIFVLSAKSGYVVTKLNTMGFDPKDLLQLGSGQASVVHTWFIDGNEPSRDGKYHSFWVHHFLKVCGNQSGFSTPSSQTTHQRVYSRASRKNAGGQNNANRFLSVNRTKLAASSSLNFQPCSVLQRLIRQVQHNPCGSSWRL
jgi:hypothetical protein